MTVTAIRKCGHPNTPENTIYEDRGGKRYSNGCRTCRNLYTKSWQQAKRRAAGVDPQPVRKVEDPDLKTCSRCGEEKSLDDFPPRPDRPGGYSRGRTSMCWLCARVNSRLWQERHPEQVKAANIRAYHELKYQVLAHYSPGEEPQCACCGEAQIVFLALDHVNNDGAAHRRKIGPGQVFRYVKREGFPLGFQTLCMNCNWAKHALGACPHKASEISEAA